MRKNFLLVYELLDEILDYGLPQVGGRGGALAHAKSPLGFSLQGEVGGAGDRTAGCVCCLEGRYEGLRPG